MDIVCNIPGKSEKFSVEKYKEELGRPYSRVNLYNCKLFDYESKWAGLFYFDNK